VCRSLFQSASWLAAAVALLAPGDVFAHKLLVVCRITDGRLRVEAFYETRSRPAADGATVTVTGANGEMIAAGKTDDLGVWSCPAPSGSYRVRVETAGHVAEQGVPAAAEEPAIPWARIGIGLGIIAALSLLVRFVRRRRADALAAGDAGSENAI
jgi:hypothetical protein